MKKVLPFHAAVAELKKQAEYLWATRQYAEATDAFLVLADAIEETGGYGATRARGCAVRARVAAWTRQQWPAVRRNVDGSVERNAPIDIDQIEILPGNYPLSRARRRSRIAVRVDRGPTVMIVSVGRRDGDIEIEDEC